MTSGELLKKRYNELYHEQLGSNPPELSPDVFWQKLADELRRPLAEELYRARVAMAALLITYRPHLQGNWYEKSAHDCGLELDNIGFIKGPYKHDPMSWPSSQEELRQIAQEKYLTSDTQKSKQIFL